MPRFLFFSADDSGFHPVGEVAHIAAIAKFGGQDQELSAGKIDVDRRGGSWSVMGWSLESFLAVDEHAKDDAAQRPGPLVDPHECLKPAIARLDPVRQKGRALRADPTVVGLAAEMKDWPSTVRSTRKATGRPDIGKILIAGRLSLGKIDDRRASGRARAPAR